MNTIGRILRSGIASGMLMIALSGCSGHTGATGPQGEQGPPGEVTVGVTSPALSQALNMTVSDAKVAGTPVVNFTVTNENNVPVAGLTDTDFRFNIAKLIPGTNGNPDTWQNYINRASGGAMQGSQERKSTGYNWGTLVDHKNGTYSYTFATDITSATANACPPPCTDADGNALDISYQPSLTHRIGIQMSNSAYPKSNATYDFVPAGGNVTTDRVIVDTAKCNQCHNQLVAHGSRIDTKLCVTCHNPGSWVAGSSGAANTSVDFKVYIHKIHHGESLPSVIAGTAYKIGNSDFSDVAFPQDIRNCTKCHDGADAASPQGDNWETRPSVAACGSCHDDVYFGAAPDPLKAYQTIAHPGGDVSDVDSSVCLTCHKSGGVAGSIAEEHTILARTLRGNFKFNILAICGTAVNANPVCAPGSTPTVTFSVTDPTGGTHGYPNSMYNIFSDPEFWNSTTSKPAASMTIDIAWNTRDYNNTDGTQARPSRANQFSVYGTTAASTPYGQATGALPAYAAATSNGDGTYTMTAATAIPATATGSGAIAIEGRAYSMIADPGLSGSSANRIPVKAEVTYFGITDSKPVARRVVVDAQTKCDNCHDQLSLHGGNRNDNVQLCVMCHNPNDTDVSNGSRPKDSTGNDLAIITAASLDGKKEESIDLKRMIHGIHAGAQMSLDGSTTLHGFREKGLWISGSDFSDTRFPGILNNCSNCHTGTSYQLTGIWDSPAQNGILGSTIDSTPTMIAGVSTKAEVDAALNDPADDMKISPTAAACSSCHDDALARQHMISTGNALFSATESTISSNLETCSVCHGPGGIVDVKVVHNVQ